MRLCRRIPSKMAGINGAGRPVLSQEMRMRAFEKVSMEVEFQVSSPGAVFIT
jgi:hypothetical protein